MKNPIRKLLSKPVIWYLRIKNIRNINVVINSDGAHLEKRDIEKEKRVSEQYKHVKEILNKNN